MIDRIENPIRVVWECCITPEVSDVPSITGTDELVGKIDSYAGGIDGGFAKMLVPTGPRTSVVIPT